MNTVQSQAVNTLVAAFLTIRELVVTVVERTIAETPTVSGYVINPLSACFTLMGPDGQPLADFPIIEVRKTGKFALPSIRSYKESGGVNTLLPYPLGATSFDAALFADSHVRKQGGAWLRRSPQAATAAIVGQVNNVPAPAPESPAPSAPAPEPTDAELEKMTAPVEPAPAGISAETGENTAELMTAIHGKGKRNR